MTTDAAKKAGWLPSQFRIKDYSGPEAKSAKAARKKRL